MLSTRSTYPRESAGDDEDAVSVAPAGFNTVGVQMSGSQARLLFGVSPYSPRVTVPLARVALSGDIADLVGYLNTTAATINTFKATSVDVFGTTTTATLAASTVNSDYANLTGATIDDLTAPSIETESISTNGTELYVDWYATDTKLPALAIPNNPIRNGTNSDGSKGGYQLESMLIGAAESVGTEALLYFGKSAGSWLMSLGQDALSMFSGYATLAEGAVSIGGSAASTAAAAGGDLALFEAGSEGLVMASSASEAASMFSSAGVLSELGTGFSTAAGEAGESLLAGIESSTAEFEEIIANHDLISSLGGTARWVAF